MQQTGLTILRRGQAAHLSVLSSPQSFGDVAPNAFPHLARILDEQGHERHCECSDLIEVHDTARCQLQRREGAKEARVQSCKGR